MTAIPTPARSATNRTRFDRPSVLRLMLGHGATDFYQAAVPALVPYFIATFSLTLTDSAVPQTVTLTTSVRLGGGTL